MTAEEEQPQRVVTVLGGDLLHRVRPPRRIQRFAADPGRVRPDPVDQPPRSNRNQPGPRLVGYTVDWPPGGGHLGRVLQRFLAIPEIPVPAQQRTEDV